MNTGMTDDFKRDGFISQLMTRLARLEAFEREFRLKKFSGGGGGDVSFEAYQNTLQSIASGGAGTVLICDVETYDGGAYYNTANGRFTPLVAGTYLFDACATISTLGDAKEWWIGFRKSGGTTYWRTAQVIGAIGSPEVNSVQRFYMNGTTDYAEVIVWHNHGSNRDTVTGVYCRFGGYKISDSDIVGI